MPLQKSVIAQELGSHVHGLTELNVVIVNQNVQIEFISPAINLLGFERASNSPEENKLFNEVLEDLRQQNGCLVTNWKTVKCLHQYLRRQNSEAMK